jgi:hypothetical protein
LTASSSCFITESRRLASWGPSLKYPSAASIQRPQPDEGVSQGSEREGRLVPCRLMSEGSLGAVVLKGLVRPRTHHLVQRLAALEEGHARDRVACTCTTTKEGHKKTRPSDPHTCHVHCPHASSFDGPARHLHLYCTDLEIPYIHIPNTYLENEVNVSGTYVHRSMLSGR